MSNLAHSHRLRVPENARPYEVAILVAYYHLGITDPNKLQDFFHYKTKKAIYTTLKKYRNLRVSSYENRLHGEQFKSVEVWSHGMG